MWVARPSPDARGLKHAQLREAPALLGRASLTGRAWVETCVARAALASLPGRASLTGRAWVETPAPASSPPRPAVARPSPDARGLKLRGGVGLFRAERVA